MNRLLCSPEGFRVWQGYRNERYMNDRQNFIEKLGTLFIPATVQMIEPVGLSGYFPAILPETHFQLPDEIALVMYPSQHEYYESKEKTTAGQAYSALHGTVFNFSYNSLIPRSKSNFPIKYSNEVKFGQPYYLRDELIDWRDGNTRVYCARRLLYISPREFKAYITTAIGQWQKENSRDIDGSIIICEENFLIYWEHSSTSDSLFPYLEAVLKEPLVSGQATQIEIPKLDIQPYTGVTIKLGDSLDVRLDQVVNEIAEEEAKVWRRNCRSCCPLDKPGFGAIY